MAYDVSKITKLEALKALAEKVKAETAALNSKYETLEAKVEDITTIGGEPNVIDTIKVNNEKQTVTDKTVNITVPTKVSDLTNDQKYQTESDVATAVAEAGHLKRKIVDSVSDIDLTTSDADQYIYMVKKSDSEIENVYEEYMVVSGTLEKIGSTDVDLSGYVQKEDGKGLSTNDYTTAEKTKLAGIDEGANKYVHPTYTSATAGLYKITVNTTGHVSKVTAVTKTDLTALGLPAQDTTYNLVTTTDSGLMSADDKTKLDGMNLAESTEVSEMLTEVFG